jgi:hypothetical protein
MEIQVQEVLKTSEKIRKELLHIILKTPSTWRKE